MERKLYILEIEGFEGETVSVYVSGRGDDDSTDAVYCIVAVSEHGASIVDSGYSSIDEARAAWPEAIPPNPGECLTPASAEHNAIEANTSTPQPGRWYPWVKD
jgi:hypothetical protein